MFRLAALLGLVLLPVIILAARLEMRDLPDRVPEQERTAAVRFEAERPGLWRVVVDDRRWGGVSALAIDRGRLLALTDSGVLVSLPRPGTGGLARVRELPDGPGPPDEKRNRDSEAMLRDPGGRGWWVAFEFRHSLWLFDPRFRTAIRQVPLRAFGFSVNRGVEAMVPGRARPDLLPEYGSEVLRNTGANWQRVPMRGAAGSVSDAAHLPDGRTVIALREVTTRGLRNRLAWLERDRSGYRLTPFAVLPLGPFDNVEGLAAEALADGSIRLWAITDNDGSRFRQTRLLALRLSPTH